MPPETPNIDLGSTGARDGTSYQRQQALPRTVLSALRGPNTGTLAVPEGARRALASTYLAPVSLSGSTPSTSSSSAASQPASPLFDTTAHHPDTPLTQLSSLHAGDLDSGGHKYTTLRTRGIGAPNPAPQFITHGGTVPGAAALALSFESSLPANTPYGAPTRESIPTSCSVSTVLFPAYLSTIGLGNQGNSLTRVPLGVGQPEYYEPLEVQNPLVSNPSGSTLTADLSHQISGTPQTLPVLSHNVNPFASTMARDTLLTYAHSLYANITSPSVHVSSSTRSGPPASFGDRITSGSIQMPFFLPMLLQSTRSPQEVNSTSSIYPSTDNMEGVQGPPSEENVQHRMLKAQLLPLLLSLQQLHPTHIPTLLLLSCVYHFLGDYNASLTINGSILSLDPTYVEAMSNVGTTLQILGWKREAEAWWFMALRTKPTYWDAIDNLIGSLCEVIPPQRPHPRSVNSSDTITGAETDPGRVVTEENESSSFEIANLLATSDDPWHEPSGAAFLSRFMRSAAFIYPSTLSSSSSSSSSTSPVATRYDDALLVCDYVLERILGSDHHPIKIIPSNPASSTPSSSSRRTQPSVPFSQIYRLQNLMHTAGNLRSALFDQYHHTSRPYGPRRTSSPTSLPSDGGLAGIFSSKRKKSPRPMGRDDARGTQEQFRALEIALRPRRTTSGTGETPWPSGPEKITFEEYNYTSRDLIIAICVAGLLASPPTATQHAHDIDLAAFLLPEYSSDVDPRVALYDGRLDLLSAVHKAGDDLVVALLRKGGSEGSGVLPTVYLGPEHVSQLSVVLFRRWKGVLPALCVPSEPASGNIGGTVWTLGPQVDDAVIKSAHQTTSTILLTLAKTFHSNTPTAIAFHHEPRRNPGSLELRAQIRASLSLVLLFYYAALALYPSPSSINNLGILIASLADPTYEHAGPEVREVALARAYYVLGLSLDENNPHLLTNLGSLLRDAGMVDEAIQLYVRAILAKPDFHIALGNMANALKDTGRIQESADLYRRAVDATPSFSDAIAGLASTMSAICDWRGRGCLQDGVYMDDFGRLIAQATNGASPMNGWMDQLVTLCEAQINEAYKFAIGVVSGEGPLDALLGRFEHCIGHPFTRDKRRSLVQALKPFFTELEPEHRKDLRLNEASFVIRFVEYMNRILQRRWYIDTYGLSRYTPYHLTPIHSAMRVGEATKYARLRLPPSLSIPPAVSVLPFNTFGYPLSTRTMRLISHRAALRVSHSVLSNSHLPLHVYSPPPPPAPRINLGYVSSDINNHPLSHLMQTAFTLHDPARFQVFIYALAPSDGSPYRMRIQSQTQNFRDVSGWSTEHIAEQVVVDQIHILINLNGYTKGARNDIFAARPAPLQMAMMGFAGTLAAGWCDYLIADPISAPASTSSAEAWLTRKKVQPSTPARAAMSDPNVHMEMDPECLSEDWIYTEKLLLMPHTFFVTDHRQTFAGVDWPLPSNDPNGAWLAEEVHRARLREEIFPDIPPETFIFANFSQLYKIDPLTFAAWLRILAKVPQSILWLLRFPAAGEEHLLRQAAVWGGEAISQRIRFTEVTYKEAHVARGRVADLFLDTLQCNAHTVAADCLWSATPLLTCLGPPTRMCARIAASIAYATGFGDQMVVNTLSEYEERAVAFANSLKYNLVNTPMISSLAPTPWHSAIATMQTVWRVTGPLADLRRALYMNRHHMPLYDTLRWTRNLERGLDEAWQRWVSGTEFIDSTEWDAAVHSGGNRLSGLNHSSAIWVQDNAPLFPRPH